MNNRRISNQLCAAIGGYRLLITAAMMLAAASPVCADELVRVLDQNQNRRGHMGDFHLVRLKETEKGAQNRQSATLEIITVPGIPPEDYASRTHKVLHIRPNYTLPPIDKPVLMQLRLLPNNRIFIIPFQMDGKPTIYIDRGVPGDRLYDTTVRLLFPQPGDIDLDAFYKELLELAGDDDPTIATLAASYIGSSLNAYANPQCPDVVIKVFANYILEQATRSQQEAMAMFFHHARLPRDPRLILALLASGNNHVATAVRGRFGQEPNRAGELAEAMAAAMLATDGPPVREHLLRVALAWGREARPLWAAAEALVVDAERLDVSQDDQALAAQVLAKIDPDRARGTIRDALHRLDSPAIYRFVYEQRMYDTIGILIDTLRHDATRHNDTVLALLAVLTRNMQPSGKDSWIAWWDTIVQQGRSEEMVRRQFVPADGQGASLDGLIDQLGDNEFKRRRQAFDRLHAIGPMANPWLEKALEHPDAEVAIAAEQLIAENERRMKPVIDRLYGR